jgi:amino acid permease
VVVGLIPYVHYAGYSVNSDCLAGRTEECVQDSITLNLPHVWWSYAVTFGYCAALVFSYPFMLFPAVEVLERAWLPGFLPSWGDEVGLPTLERRAKHEKVHSDDPAASVSLLSDPSSFPVANSPPLARLRTNLFRTLVCVLTLLIAYIGAPQLDNMVSLIGAFCCTPIAFIFPAWFHAELVCGDKRERRLEKAVDWGIVLLGGAIMCFSTFMAIDTWKTNKFDPCIGG